MTERRILITLILGAGMLTNSIAQPVVISKNKPLGILNPAMQVEGVEHGMVSLSYLSVFNETSNLNYLGVAEFRLGSFGIGMHGSSINNRYNKSDLYKGYANYVYEFEPGNTIQFGVEAGFYQDRVRVNFFNEAYAPTHFELNDSIANGLDLGLGLAIKSQGLTVGFAVNKFNDQNYVAYPREQFSVDPTDSTSLIRADTTIVLGTDNFRTYSIQSVLNLGYEWNVGSTRILHLVNVHNLDLAGYDYVELQNFMTFRERFTLGLGLFSHSDLSYFTSLRYAFTPSMQLEVAAFFQEEYEFDTDAPYPINYANGYNIKAKGASVAQGLQPSFEVNLQLGF